MVKQSNSWSLFLRYQAQTERHYRRAVEEFERVRALTPESRAPSQQNLPNEPNLDIQAQENELVTTCETGPFPPAGTSPSPRPVTEGQPCSQPLPPHLTTSIPTAHRQNGPVQVNSRPPRRRRPACPTLVGCP